MQKINENPKVCKLLTLIEAAELLGINRVTLSKLVKAGQLSTVNISKKTKRISENELIRFSKGGAV